MVQGPDSGKERRWLEVMRAWQRSRLSVRHFCRRRGLSEPSFYAWRRVLRERGLLGAGAVATGAAVPAFVRVAVEGGGARTAFVLDFAQGRELGGRAGFW